MKSSLRQQKSAGDVGANYSGAGPAFPGQPHPYRRHGERTIVAGYAQGAASLAHECIRTTKDREPLRAAVHVFERVAGAARVDSGHGGCAQAGAHAHIPSAKAVEHIAFPLGERGRGEALVQVCGAP